jgi:hypothetical protein
MPDQFPFHRRRDSLADVVEAIDRLTAQVALVAKELTPTNTDATSCKLTIAVGGNQMAAVITVDTTDGTVNLEFQDDKGDAAEAPVGAGVVFSSDTPSVCTVAVDAASDFQGDLTPVAVGSFVLSAQVTGNYANGTPIETPAPLPLTIVAGAAASDLLVAAASN